MRHALAQQIRPYLQPDRAQPNPMATGTKWAIGLAAAAIVAGVTIKIVRAAKKPPAEAPPFWTYWAQSVPTPVPGVVAWQSVVADPAGVVTVLLGTTGARDAALATARNYIKLHGGASSGVPKGQI